MRRADRLFQIVQYLRQRRLTTAAWLAQRLEVSERTIYRDIQDLMCSGVPVEGEAGVGYVLRAGFDLPPLMFSREELEALVVGARMVQTWTGGRMADYAGQAMAKIEAVLPGSLRGQLDSSRIYVPDMFTSSAFAECFEQLRVAINERQVVEFTYTSLKQESSRRSVCPLGLFFWGRAWTLAAWCELRKDYRSFRVDLIDELVLLPRRFQEQSDLSLQDFFSCVWDMA